jgi:hypothetical protein
VSRKAYCFPDQRHYETWLQGVDPLVPEIVLRTLTDALAERGAFDPTGPALTDGELAGLLITEFIDFP